MVPRNRSTPPIARALASGADGAVWDELADSSGRIRSMWKDTAAKMQSWSPDERGVLSTTAARMMEDLGTTFNVYNDVADGAQPYQLDPLPLMISRDEWAKVSTGLVQRARLMAALVADLYGPQRLLAEGILPPDLVHSNPLYQPQTRGMQPVGGRFLITSACDLVRNPAGQWMVLADHTRGTGGLGQVLQNRHVVSNLLSDCFEAAPIHRLGRYFELEKLTLQEFCGLRTETPNVVVMTPGFRHPSYFEYAYKARLLGFPLVEAADLTVRERRLYLKTLGGLRRVDGVACRIDDNGIDPLEYWTLGGGGVPGMIEAWRSGNVALANAPGSGFASSPALMPFLPRACKFLLDEDLKLPFVETWWLGQASIRRQILDQLHRYVLMSAFNPQPLLPIRCGTLSAAARRKWVAAIEESPHDFVVQKEVSPSQMPALEGRSLSSKPFFWRTFAVHAKDGPSVMPGGMARVGKSGKPPQLWPWHAGHTKDVWVADSAIATPGPTAVHSLNKTPLKHVTAMDVPSRIAEQLFWVGRYAERIESVTRLLRVTLRQMGGESGRRQREHLAACQALIEGSRLFPETDGIQSGALLSTLTSLVHDTSDYRSLARLTRSLMSNAAAARDRLSDDTWRLFNRLEGLLHSPSHAPRATDLAQTLDTLILHLAALAGMEAENMTRGQGWRFFETGRRIERAISTLKLLQTAAGDDGLKLDPLLETCDSVMTYRRRHFSRPDWEGVRDLIFWDTLNPRSVAFQMEVLDREMQKFPGDPKQGLFPDVMELLAEMNARFAQSGEAGIAEFEWLEEAFEKLSDLLTQHYFSHSVRRVY
ncbi:circularly permuted type 2 ATP-grasp protein [Luteolibacter pohnpeiensis]|uniref:Circularly permuted type 2 ATP-grasp protein n=1 Tax=Luteolibacter pohnpeiensis TaxID=454153 RepID=A0A934S9Z1_9BACT|nr:circularly permuted type 2 ATP-grasp protein [Luteolibacter pohnpeiensis]MBK1882054.1 circularly permuted type 2 ATP-grasp protein [Luteolibacter pohnpeiensis]